MLTSLLHAWFAWTSREAHRQRRQVEDRLRAQSGRARIEPSTSLYGRTLAALNDVSARSAPAVPMDSPLRRVATGGYALAFVSLVVIGAVAVQFGLPGEVEHAGPADSTRSLAIFNTTAFDSVFPRQLRELNETWESPLRTEARLIARDARTLSAKAMASVSLLTAWGHRGDRGRSEGSEG